MTDTDNELQELYLKLLIDAGCKLVFKTTLFGKQYVWMKDANNVLFLEALPAPVHPTEVSVGPLEVPSA